MTTLTRRSFLVQSSLAASSTLALPRILGALDLPVEPAFQISLAGWSLHRRHFQEQQLPVMDFPAVARGEFGIGAIELVNTMLPVPTYHSLQKLLQAAAKDDVKILLIMCDAEGNLSAADEDERLQAVRNHHKWIDIAEVLGCHSIRVNTGGRAKQRDDMGRCADSLRRLGDYGGEHGIHVLVENHGGLSSHAPSLVDVMRRAASYYVGTLPDFGNFPEGTDIYRAVEMMMPYARAVSAKCHDFDAEGQESRIDFARMLKVVLDAGYRGHVGIEYEGSRLSEHDGITAARDLLVSLGGALGA